jgi:outer membrane protein assembly factor BamB
MMQASEVPPMRSGAFPFLSCAALLAFAVPSHGCSSSQSGAGFDAGGGDAGNDGVSSDDGGPQVCTPGAKQCDMMNSAQTCRADGSGWDSVPCLGGVCMNGDCACMPGSVVCNGDQVLACGTDNMYHMKSTCPAGTTCRDGLCDDVRCNEEVNQNGEFSLPTQGWPRYRHDNRNSGWTHAVVADKPTLQWKVKIGGTNLNGATGGLASGPVVDQNDRVLQGGGDLDGMNGGFYAFDSTGKPSFTFSGGPRGYGWTTPAVRSDGVSYYSTEDGNAYAVNPSGTQAWKYMFGFQNDCSPIVTKDGNIIYGSDSGSLFAMHPDGTPLWTSDTTAGPGEVDAALAESCDGVIYAGGRNGWVTLNAQTGATIWKVAATGGVVALMSSPVVTADGTMYGLDSGGILYAIDKTGKVLWQKTVTSGSSVSDVAHVADRIYTVLNDGTLHAYKAADGTDVWSKPVGNAAETYKHAGPIVDGNQRLYFNSNDGNVYAFDTSGNQLWKLAASGVSTGGGSGYGTMAIDKDGRMYVPGNDGYLYAFK